METIAGKSGHVNYDTVPNIVYTFPELATVGLTEEQCKEGGYDYNVGKFPLTANSRAKTNDQAEGLVKVVFALESHDIDSKITKSFSCKSCVIR